MAGTTVTYDEAALVAALAERDIRHLRLAAKIDSSPQLTTTALIEALANSSSPRLREALILLFLRHPEYAGVVPALAAGLDERARLVLRHMYTTAVYLQRLWRTTLSLYLGDLPSLPDYFGQSDFDLPTPERKFGEAGLRALAELFQEITGHDWLSVYNSAISLFLAQLSLEQNPVS